MDRGGWRPTIWGGLGGRSPPVKIKFELCLGCPRSAWILMESKQLDACLFSAPFAYSACHLRFIHVPPSYPAPRHPSIRKAAFDCLYSGRRAASGRPHPFVESLMDRCLRAGYADGTRMEREAQRITKLIRKWNTDSTCHNISLVKKGPVSINLTPCQRTTLHRSTKEG
jgi:hypothetical protein